MTCRCMAITTVEQRRGVVTVGRRYEQLTLQMALAAALHHSRDVGARVVSAEPEDCQGRGVRTAETQDPPHPQPELFSLYEEEPGGAWPGSVTDPAPQVRVERHVVEHRIEACPFVQILDAPEPQGGNQLVEAFRHLDLHSAQDLVFTPSLSQAPGSRGADGGTVGGSAGIRVVCLSVPAADR